MKLSTVGTFFVLVRVYTHAMCAWERKRASK